MLSLLKNDKTSRLIVGPLMRKRTGKSSTNYKTAELLKKVSEERLAEVIRDCTARSDQVALLRAMNRAGLTTLKNEQRTGQKPTKLGLWDFKRREYVKALSIRGFFLMARFRIYLAIENLRMVKH
jgi:hypothetical protein